MASHLSQAHVIPADLGILGRKNGCWLPWSMSYDDVTFLLEITAGDKAGKSVPSELIAPCHHDSAGRR